MASGIYKITCITNGKYYYGSAINMTSRWCGHKRTLTKQIHHNQFVQSVWNKYGGTSFLFEIECECSLEDLRPLEQAYLDEYWGKPECMNIARFASDRPHKISRKCGTHLTDNHRRKISRSMIGLRHTEEAKRKIGEASRLRMTPDHTRQIGGSCTMRRIGNQMFRVWGRQPIVS